MYKNIWFLLLFVSVLYATPTVVIDADSVNIEDFELEYFVDKTGDMQIDDVLKQMYLPQTNRLSLGANHELIWIRFNLRNDTNRTKKVYIHSQIAYMAKAVTFYEVHKDISLRSLNIDFINEKESKEHMYGSNAIFEMTLKKGETKSVYIRNLMEGMQFSYLTIYDDTHSKNALHKQSFVVLLIIGMLIALALYHGIVYFSTGAKEYAYYALYLVSAVILWSLLTGILASYFSIYYSKLTEHLLLSLDFLSIFLTFFIKAIFDTAKKHTIENHFLNSIIFFSILYLIIGFFDMGFAIGIAPFIIFYMCIVFWVTTYFIMKKGNPLAIIFLLGNSAFIILMTINNLYYSGIFQYSAFVQNASLIGTLIEAMTLALILSYRIKLLQKNEREKDKILFQKNKLESMGEMIGSIAHQWRQPLSVINMTAFDIQTQLDLQKYDLNDKISQKEFVSFLKKELHDIHHYTQYLSNTIDDFKNYFSPDKVEELTTLNIPIENALAILNPYIEKESITVETKLQTNAEVMICINELMQIVVSIIHNSIENFKVRGTINPHIIISTKEVNDVYSINICDNGGGIDKAVMPKIFDLYFSTKDEKHGTGLGLYMSKVLLEHYGRGSLSANNNENGVCFEICLHKPNLKEA